MMRGQLFFVDLTKDRGLMFDCLRPTKQPPDRQATWLAKASSVQSSVNRAAPKIGKISMACGFSKQSERRWCQSSMSDEEDSLPHNDALQSVLFYRRNSPRLRTPARRLRWLSIPG